MLFVKDKSVFRESSCTQEAVPLPGTGRKPAPGKHQKSKLTVVVAPAVTVASLPWVGWEKVEATTR